MSDCIARIDFCGVMIGAPWSVDVEVWQDEARTVAWDFTGATARMQVRGPAAAYSGSDPAMELTTENGGLVLEGGVVKIRATSGKTDGMWPLVRAGVLSFVHDLWIVQSGEAYRLWTGKLDAQFPITRPVS